MTGYAKNIKKRTDMIRQEAHRLGFNAIGFAKARRLNEQESRLENWLKEGRHGTMGWMNNHFEKRLDPRRLVPGAESVVSVLISYRQPDLEQRQNKSDHPKISKYALGEDYHNIVKEKLYELFAFTESVTGKVEGRVFVDSAPVMDKHWAAESGLGWMGKHANILNREWGSWFFLGEMILDAEFEYDQPVADHCGSCTRCIDACPTDAIYEPYKVDGSKCISYFTIELRDEIPEQYHQQIGDWIFGCDICQDVCPWNSKAGHGSEKRLFAKPDREDRDIDFWEELNLQEYRAMFKKNPVKRAGFDGFKRNIRIAGFNVKKRDICE